MKVQNLTGAALDWAVALCQERRVYIGTNHTMTGPCINDADLVDMGVDGTVAYSPSTDQYQGGSIIDAERISTQVGHSGVWVAASYYTYDEATVKMHSGPTRLIAAMRAFVMSVIGEDIDIPEELT